MLANCANFSTTMRATATLVSTANGCQEWPLDRYDLVVEPSIDGDGGFKLTLFSNSAPPDEFLTCCALLIVSVCWPEVGLDETVIFAGKLGELEGTPFFDRATVRAERFTWSGNEKLQQYSKQRIGFDEGTPQARKGCVTVVTCPAEATVALAPAAPFHATAEYEIQLDNPCGATQAASFALVSATNANASISADGKLTVTPLAAGPFDVTYTVTCDCEPPVTLTWSAAAAPFTNDFLVTGGAAGDAVTIEAASAGDPCFDPTDPVYIINPASLNNVNVTNDGGGTFTATPIAAGPWSFDYSVFCADGADCGGVVRNGSIIGDAGECVETVTGCTTNIEAAYEFLFENLIGTSGRGDGSECAQNSDDCLTITPPSAELIAASANFVGDRAYDSLLDAVTKMGKTDGWRLTTAVTRADDGDCCYRCEIGFASRNARSLEPLTLSPCDGTVQILGYARACERVNRVHVVGDGVTVTVCADDFDPNCICEHVIEVEGESDPAALEIIANEFLQTQATGDEITFAVPWSCNLLPVGGSLNSAEFLYIGDTILIDWYGERLFQMVAAQFHIRNGNVLRIYPTFQEVV